MSFRMKLLRSYWKTLTSLFEFYAATPVTLPSMLFLNKSDFKHVPCCLPLPCWFVCGVGSKLY